MPNQVLFRRLCQVKYQGGAPKQLQLIFCIPAYNEVLKAFKVSMYLESEYFEAELFGIGEDEAQAFFMLPKVSIDYLKRKAEEGYISYWWEEGDLDYQDFWTYKP